MIQAQIYREWGVAIAMDDSIKSRVSERWDEFDIPLPDSNKRST